MNLGSNHRRVLGVRFSQLEERLSEIERLLTVHSEESLFGRRVDRISAEEKSELTKLLGEAREELRDMDQVLRLDFGEYSNRAQVQSLLAFAWSDLEDTRPQKLAGYGQVPPEAESFLSPRIQRLIDLVLTMSSVLSGGDHPANVADAPEELE